MIKLDFKTPRSMTGISSVYVDVLRLCCALTVFSVHSIFISKPDFPYYTRLNLIAHFAVVVFFCLSGFVIAHTTTVKKRTWKEYVVARFSRLYSILVPAIVLLCVCSFFVLQINPDLYKEYDNGHFFVRIFTTLTFTGELFGFPSAPNINTPLWSLSYEFWYYVLFGFIAFRVKGWKGWLLPVIVLIIITPQILLLLPIWLSGYFAYYLRIKSNLTNTNKWKGVICSLVAAIILLLIMPEIPDKINPPLNFSSQFITDWVHGFFIALSLLFLPIQEERNLSKQKKYLAKVRMLGNMTYPIYVFHYPILVLLKAINGNTTNSTLIFNTVICLVVCFAFGLFFESKKKYWDKFFTKIILRT